jgi:hypothetical protein
MQRRFLVFVLLFATAALAQKPQDPVGQWNLEADAQGQISKFILTITKEGAVLKGKIASETYGAQDLTDLKFENDTLTYTRNLEIGGQAVAMAFKGKIEGDKLTGTYDVMGLELPVKGSRKTAGSGDAPPANK